MWNVRCEMWDVKCGMWNVECGMWNVECEMWNVECEVCSVECEKGAGLPLVHTSLFTTPSSGVPPRNAPTSGEPCSMQARRLFHADDLLAEYGAVAALQQVHARSKILRFY